MGEEAILFIGNGYDIGRGLPTKYEDFLNHHRNILLCKIKRDIENFYKTIPINYMNMNNVYLESTTLNEEQIKLFKVIQKKAHQSIEAKPTFKEVLQLNEFYDYIQNDIITEYFLRYVIGNYEYKLTIFDKYNKEILKDENSGDILSDEKKAQENIWIEYFLHLYYLNLNKEKKSSRSKISMKSGWANLEELIKDNFINPSDPASIDKYFEEQYQIKFDDSKKILEFKEMKKLLSIYINDVSIKSEVGYLGRKHFNKYKNIINFNYTQIPLKESVPEISSEIQYIHGKASEGNIIIFGFDENEFFNSEKKRIDDHGIYYTKINQIIERNTKKDIKLYQNLFAGKVYKILGILGHSIGICDYSYFYNIIKKNLNEIAISVYYFTDGTYNNKNELQKALYKLFSYIEVQENKSIYHDMVISGRIKFILIQET